MKIYFLNFAVVLMLMISCVPSKSADITSPADLKEMVNNPETTLVDVRVPEEFNQKTAKGAVNIPLAKIQDNIEFFKKQKKVVVFCNRGFQASEALEILKKNGVENVYTGKTLDNVVAIQKEK